MTAHRQTIAWPNRGAIDDVTLEGIVRLVEDAGEKRPEIWIGDFRCETVADMWEIPDLPAHPTWAVNAFTIGLRASSIEGIWIGEPTLQDLARRLASLVQSELEVWPDATTPPTRAVLLSRRRRFDAVASRPTYAREVLPGGDDVVATSERQVEAPSLLQSEVPSPESRRPRWREAPPWEIAALAVGAGALVATVVGVAMR